MPDNILKNALGKDTCLLPAAYFGPVSYWACLMAFPHVIIDGHEHYVKQTLRNRTVILSESGPLTLTVPVERPVGAGFNARPDDVRPQKEHTPVCQILVSGHGDWPRHHLQALRTAYEKSPFFEYYIDDLMPLFEKPVGQTLLDFNLRCLKTVCSLLDFHPGISLSAAYETHPAAIDLRNYHWETGNLPRAVVFTPVAYYQVFSGKFGFTPNLSILDLLFNMGPETPLVLRDGISKRL